MISLSIPEDGDVVVGIVQMDARTLYVLSVVPRQGQCAYADRQEAMARAVAYAEWTGTNAWYADPETQFEILGEFRVPSVPALREFFRDVVK